MAGTPDDSANSGCYLKDVFGRFFLSKIDKEDINQPSSNFTLVFPSLSTCRSMRSNRAGGKAFERGYNLPSLPQHNAPLLPNDWSGLAILEISLHSHLSRDISLFKPYPAYFAETLARLG
jgi:hypothetical protein